VVWTVANPVWLANGSAAPVPATSARHHTHDGGDTHSSIQEQFQGKNPTASSPSSLGASPLRKLSVDLFYTMFLLHPWPNSLAAISGWFRDSVDKSLNRGSILRVPPLATGVTSYAQLQELIKRQTKSLGKYHLTTEQIMSLLSIIAVLFTERLYGSRVQEYDAKYADLLVNDLLHQPKFAEAVKLGNTLTGKIKPRHLVIHYLAVKQPELAFEMIRVAGLNIDRVAISGALASCDLAVLAKVCKHAEKFPQSVGFTKSEIEGLIANAIRGNEVTDFPDVNPQEFRDVWEPCLKVARLM